MTRRSHHLVGWWLGALLVACGGPGAPPREYRSLPEHAGADRSEGREPLASEPRIVVLPSSSPVITFRVSFLTGSAADSPGRQGITNLTAQLMVEGGAGDLTSAEQRARLFPIAGEIGAQVGRDQTVFVGQVHRDHLDSFYPLFRDVLLRPRMPEADFQRIQRTVQVDLTLNLRRTRDEALGQEALQAVLYEGHPFAHPVLGSERGLSRIRVEDTRAHRMRVFCAGRAIAGIAGDFPPALEARLRQDLRTLSGDRCLGRARLPVPPTRDGPSVHIVHRPDAEAVAVSMGMPIAVRRDHDDYPALVLAAAWLGQHRQFVGRLMQQIRGERGLNYGDYAYAEHFTQEGWSRFPLANDSRRQQYFSIWLRPLRPDTAHFAIRLAVRELRRLIQEGMDQEEFERVRLFAEQYYALYLQTASRRLGYAIDDAFYGLRTPFLERLRDAWGSLSAERVSLAVQEHLDPDQLAIALVASDAEQLADAIAQDSPSPVEYRSEVSEAVRTADREIVNYSLGVSRDRIRILAADQWFR